MASSLPEIVNPYPDNWSEDSKITDFVYETRLHLHRVIKAVQIRDGEDAAYIVSVDYVVSFKLDGDSRRITVPKGMLTDLVSVPWLFRFLVGRVGPQLEAAIIHDYLYVAWQDFPDKDARDQDRRFADELMRVAMEAANVGSVKKFLIYNAVKWFGESSYHSEDPERYVTVPFDINPNNDS